MRRALGKREAQVRDMLNLDALVNPPPLESERILLRRLNMRDATDIFEYSRDPEVARHVLWSAHTSPSESRSYIRYMLRRYRMGRPSSWGIVWKETGARDRHHRLYVDSARKRLCRGGLFARPRVLEPRVMTEALKLVLRFSFDRLRLNRVEAQHEVDNLASGAVMRKAGMRREGTLRQRLCNKGRFVDVDLYAIVRSDLRR